MGLGYYDPDRRHRRRRWATITKSVLFIVILAAAIAFAYQFGAEQTRGREARLTAEIEGLTAAKTTLEQQAVQLQAAAQTADAQYKDLLARFEREVPTGVARTFADQIAARLAEGISPDRLALYIAHASEPRDCEPGESKRFILATQAYSGSNTSVSFGRNRIVVGGRGESVLDEEGRAQPWFNSTAPVTVTFQTIQGAQETATGVLPVVKTVVVGDEEWHFTIAEDEERGFIRVTSETCAFG
jgi:hypothetical protein